MASCALPGDKPRPPSLSGWWTPMIPSSRFPSTSHVNHVASFTFFLLLVLCSPAPHVIPEDGSLQHVPNSRWLLCTEKTQPRSTEENKCIQYMVQPTFKWFVTSVSSSVLSGRKDKCISSKISSLLGLDGRMVFYVMHLHTLAINSLRYSWGLCKYLNLIKLYIHYHILLGREKLKDASLYM